jgi:hypothetical protein
VETADLSTPLRSGRDDKSGAVAAPPLPFFLSFPKGICFPFFDRLGTPYVARSSRQIGETADLSAPLRSGRDDKSGAVAAPPLLFFLSFPKGICL